MSKHDACRQADLSKVDRSTVTVVQSNTVEHPRCISHVALHVFPEKRTISRTVTVAQLHVVTPRYQLTTEVDVGP